MALIEGLSPDVPLITPPILPGFYTAEVTEANIEASKSKQGEQNLVIELKITGNLEGMEVPDQGRMTTSYTSLKNKTALYRIFLSAGLNPQGVADTAELKGRTVKINLINEPYVDDKTKEQRVSARIREFILPPEFEEKAKQQMAARAAVASGSGAPIAG